MSDDDTYEAFPSIPRLFRTATITEKIDGSNGCILVPEDPSAPLRAGSRNRWLEPTKSGDNFGFARWVADNAEELRAGLGPGRHFGEWWGCGIQRGYGLCEKRFSLFNVSRWANQNTIDEPPALLEGQSFAPACCYVVPLLYRGPFSTVVIAEVLAALQESGSHAIPFMNPEGIVVWHEAARQLFKVTLGDDGHKGARK